MDLDLYNKKLRDKYYVFDYICVKQIQLQCLCLWHIDLCGRSEIFIWFCSFILCSVVQLLSFKINICCSILMGCFIYSCSVPLFCFLVKFSFKSCFCWFIPSCFVFKWPHMCVLMVLLHVSIQRYCKRWTFMWCVCGFNYW